MSAVREGRRVMHLEGSNQGWGGGDPARLYKYNGNLLQFSTYTPFGSVASGINSCWRIGMVCMRDRECPLAVMKCHRKHEVLGNRKCIWAECPAWQKMWIRQPDCNASCESGAQCKEVLQKSGYRNIHSIPRLAPVKFLSLSMRAGVWSKLVTGFS